MQAGENMLVLYLTYIDEEQEKLKFENLYYTYRKQMAAVAMSVVCSREDAEDIVHEVFLNIASKHMEMVCKISDERDLRNYMLKAVKNTALNWKKKRGRWLFLENDIEIKNDTLELSDDKFVEYLCEKMEYERVLEAIKALETKYQNVLYYHFVMELPVPQVAKSLSQSLAATKKQLVRGKKKLLQILGEEDGYGNDQSGIKSSIS
jgi:RNA polymerase sigma-70 factor (ECF subfamily)